MKYLEDPDVTLYQGDALEVLRTLPDESVHMACTSPPFYGLRDYQVEGQIGLEPTPDEWVAKLVDVFREVRRVLRKDGTLWLEIGDSYASGQGGALGATSAFRGEKQYTDGRRPSRHFSKSKVEGDSIGRAPVPAGHKPKDLIGAPWLLAFALRADGWYLRSEIIWSKPNPMPESVTDRPTTAHSRVFLLTKSPRYFYDAEAIREKAQDWGGSRPDPKRANGEYGVKTMGGRADPIDGNRNRRSVWEIPTEPYPEAHFATWPQKLVEPMILAGTEEGGTVLDCFAGSGTTLYVARRLGRRAIGIELSADYCALAAKRLAQQSIFA